MRGLRRRRGRDPRAEPEASPATDRFGDGRAEIFDAWFEDEHGERAETLATAAPARSRPRPLQRQVEDPLFGINLQNGTATTCCRPRTSGAAPAAATSRRVSGDPFRIRFENVLAPDRYHVTPAVARHGGAWIDRRERMISIIATGTHNTDALLELPYDVEIERGSAAPGHGARAVSLPSAQFGPTSPCSMGWASRSRALGSGVGPAQALDTDLGARQDRVQARLLRLGTRIPVAADAPAAAVRRHLPRPEPLDLAADEQTALLPGRAAAGHRPVQLLQRVHRRGRHLPRQPREPRPQDRLPATGGAALDRHDRAVEPRR